MPLDNQIRTRILEVATEHFFRLGFSKVTMSEIAEELGMSKKTLYEYFPSKETLLSEIIITMQTNSGAVVDTIVADTSIDFVEKMKRLFAHGAAFHTKFSKHFLVDLQKNAPQIWKCCDDFRIERMRLLAERLVREGIEQGFFRNDVNVHVLILLYTTAVQNLVTPEILSQIPVTMQQLFETIIKIIFEGILTPEARSGHMPSVLPSKQEPGPLA